MDGVGHRDDYRRFFRGLPMPHRKAIIDHPNFAPNKHRLQCNLSDSPSVPVPTPALGNFLVLDRHSDFLAQFV